MRKSLRTFRSLTSDRSAVTSIEYGITALLVTVFVMAAGLSLQNALFSQHATKCYTLGSLAPTDNL